MRLGARLPETPAKKSNPNQNVTDELRKKNAAIIVAFSPQQEESFPADTLGPGSFCSFSDSETQSSLFQPQTTCQASH